MKKWLKSLLFLLLLIPTYFLIAQEDQFASQLEITGANASDLPTITITTNVLDSNNLPVEGLTIENFILGGDLEGIAEIVSVENITTDDLSFASVLVIDTSTSMSGLPIQQAKEAASLFVQTVGDNDPIAIVSFANRARLVQDYTTDKDLLLSVIDGLQVGGQTALYDAAVVGVEAAAIAPVNRRAVILLSDGAEFGGRSVNLREAGLETATRDGVSVYTIGLGFGTDRTYLEDLALGTNARAFESPTPEELTTIYSELASLFRSQYVITLNGDLPADGMVYEFTLQANTPAGESNVDTGTIRAPIPTPIVTLDETLFSVPFSTPVTITPDVRADDDIADITVTIDGEPVELNEDGDLLIDPVAYPPSSYELTITATDVDGDSGSASVMFETAALASDVTIDFESGTTLTEETTITLTADGQTPATSASYSILQDGTSVGSSTSTDAEANFPFTIDPFLLEAGEYELFIGVENEGGATSNVTVPFSVGNIPPRDVRVDGLGASTEITEPTTLIVTADTQAGTRIDETVITLDGETVEEIRPASLQPGNLDLSVTVTDNAGQSTTETLTVMIAALPAQITFGEIETPITSDTVLPITIDSQTDIISVTYDFDDNIDLDLRQSSDGTYNPIPITLGMFANDTVTINVEVLNSGGETTTESITLDIVLPTPTPNIEATAQAEAAISTENAVATVDAQSTSDAEEQATNEANSQATSDAQSTVDAQVAADEQATSDAQSTVDAQVAADEQATSDAQSTVDAQAVDEQATVEAQQTVDAQATDDSATEVAANIAASATATEEPTVAPTATSTETPEPTDLLPTLTPVEIVDDITAQSADEPPVEGNLTGLLLGVGGIGLALILFLILFFGRGRNRQQ